MTSDREAFLQLLSEEAFAEDGALVLEQAAWHEDSLRLVLAVECGDDTPKRLWNVQVGRTYEERLMSEWTNCVYLGRDHPALVPYREPHCDIYFTDSAVPATELVGIAAIACAGALGTWHSVSAFLNEGLGLMEGRFGAHGLLGRFPKPVAMRILSELTGAPIKTVLLNERAPVWLNGGQWVTYSDAVEVLAFGGSFVVGEGFRFEAA